MNKQKFLLDRIIKEYDPREMSVSKEYDDGQSQTQGESNSKVNSDKEGEGIDSSDN